MTWVPESPYTATWTTEIPYVLQNFLLQENGDKLLQEDSYKILLEDSWGLSVSTGNWTIDTPASTVWT